MKRIFGGLALSCLLFATSAHAATVDINGFQFNLDQFGDPPGSTASVTTSGDVDFFGSNFDNEFGLGGAELGELVSGDPGDRITLGISNDGSVGSLTLDYSVPVLIGAGVNALFVVYEANGGTAVDEEGTAFEISFNGGSFVSASAGTATLFDTPGIAASHNQIVFDLLSASFGFSVGDFITSMSIRNTPGTNGEHDPDFVFAAKAGTISAVPLPAGFALLITALGGLGGLAAWRRSA